MSDLEKNIDSEEPAEEPVAEDGAGESQIDGAEYYESSSEKSGESQITGAEYVDAPLGKSGESQIAGAEYVDAPSGKSGKSKVKDAKVYSVKPVKSGKSRIDELKAKPQAAQARPESTNYYTSKPKKSGDSTIQEIGKYAATSVSTQINSYKTGGLDKAVIINVDTGDQIKCQYNPTEYTMTKRNTWRKKSGQGQDIFATPEFKGGKPAELKMELFFDTSDTDSGDVRDTTNKIWKLMEIVPSTVDAATNKGRSYKCQFWWGGEKYFTAAVTNIRQKFIMFRPDGVPIRAKLNITFQQLGNDSVFPPQNPTSLSQARRTYVVGTGDRIDLIAFREYGDATLWHDLAAANNLENPMDLKVGQVIKIVDL